MSKISMLISQLDFAQQLLTLQIELEQSRLSHEYVSQLVVGFQKVSLAEKHLQVKNTCSHMSSTNE
ncbi:molecular chaperone [Lysinibacillus sp. 2017]|uniref:molecular chaperone n=1 Tax=unclassified Lysinibacillus TaxID=2636778 RepID=UPI000D527D5B|nr:MULTISPECIES: molecular chaperone [unclassified Lysinibacillus]AWE07030.1 molecular chaperone [Lysinibacillus sp. 2017]TGN37047.1 molecular chaperone [Lysinibacillus sp. S2017]